MNDTEYGPTLDPNSATGVYIPVDIQDCFYELDKMLPDELIERIRGCEEGDLSQHHFGLAIWMRNHWGLWSEKSRLKQYFEGLGIHEADSASSLLIASYWRYLNNLPLELPRQIVYDKIMRDEIRNGPKPGN